MKKIPGTLYSINLTLSQDSLLNLELWYLNELYFEKSSIPDQNEVINILLRFLEKEELNLPRNRLEWIVHEEMNNITEEEQHFSEKFVSKMIDQFDDDNSYSFKKIILMGLSNAGKTCIYERVFEHKTPWELMHSAATKGISYKEYSIGSISKPMIWDLGGQDQYLDTYHGDLREKIFNMASILLYVVDITDIDRLERAKEEFIWAVNQILKWNKNPKIYILLHKIDNVHDKETVINYTKKYFQDGVNDKIHFFCTSILNESLFIAWSEIIKNISPKSLYLNNILIQLKQQENISDVLVIDKKTGLACASTINISDEDLVIGMISLLIVTIDKVSHELKIEEVKEFSLKSDDSAFLLMNVNKDLLLAMLLNKRDSSIGEESLKKIKEIGYQVSSQINKLWE